MRPLIPKANEILKPYGRYDMVRKGIYEKVGRSTIFHYDKNNHGNAIMNDVVITIVSEIRKASKKGY